MPVTLARRIRRMDILPTTFLPQEGGKPALRIENREGWSEGMKTTWADKLRSEAKTRRALAKSKKQEPKREHRRPGSRPSKFAKEALKPLHIKK